MPSPTHLAALLPLTALGTCWGCSSDSTASDSNDASSPDAGAVSHGSGGRTTSTGGGAGRGPTGGAMGGTKTATPGSGGTTGSGGANVGGAEAGVAPPTNPCVDAGTCPAGVWIQHELPGLTGPDTVQTVLADPARPSDYYAFVGSNNGPTIKVYRSTDFGDSWTNRNTTAEITGNPWGASLDPNPNRDPGTPPTMWSPSGYGGLGAWKSVDGGVTWTRSAGADAAFGPFNPFGAQLTDLYHVCVLPDDPPNHVLTTYHYSFKDKGDGGFGETWDGGKTWVIHAPPDGIGTSHYVMPISATTWAVIAQANDGKNGIWRTTTAGRTGGTAAANFRDGTISASAWTKVDDLEHAHGSHQNLILKDGTIVATGWTNGGRSQDHGATWTHFTTNGYWSGDHQFNSSSMTNIAATDRYLYTDFLSSPQLTRVPIADPIGAEKWDLAYTETPAGMKDGGAPFGMASSFDASMGRWVIIAGTISSSVWKYIEP